MDDIERSETHSTHPVPFLIWNGSKQDTVKSFCEVDMAKGIYGNLKINSLELLKLVDR